MASFSDIADQVHALDTKAKVGLLHLLQAWLTEERRNEIQQHARKAMAEYEAGETRSGSVDDLMADLYEKDLEACLDGGFQAGLSQSRAGNR